MATEPAIAFAAPASKRAPIEVRVNFGVFAGRAATPAEIDELARRLLPEVGPVSIVSEERHEIDKDVEASVHQVRIEIATGALPEGMEPAILGERIAQLAEKWAESCISDRHAEIADS